MKTIKSITMFAAFLLTATTLSGQTADELIQKYLQTFGGKEAISKITSLYTEGKIEVMGNIGPVKTSILNGKGLRSEMDIMGSILTTCFNDTEGWSINPFQGGTTAEKMPADQYNQGKDQIFLGAPFIFYKEKSYKAELQGNATVRSVNVINIKLTNPEGNSTIYSIDPSTGYLMQTFQQVNMNGTVMDNVTSYSDYRKTGDVIYPYKMLVSIGGGQYEMTTTIEKLELNKNIDPAIFIKP